VTTEVAAGAPCTHCGRTTEPADADYCVWCGVPVRDGLPTPRGEPAPRPVLGWLFVGLIGGSIAFGLLEAFNLLFENPNDPFGVAEPLLQSPTFVFYPRDLARVALIGACVGAPLAAFGRRGTLNENVLAAFLGLLLGALGGAIADIAAAYLLAPDAASQYGEWFSGGDEVEAVTSTLKWMVRVPWIAIWAVFGVFTTWFVGTQTRARLAPAAFLGGALCAAAGAATLELAFEVENVNGDLLTFSLCALLGIAVSASLAATTRRQTPPNVEPGSVAAASGEVWSHG